MCAMVACDGRVSSATQRLTPWFRTKRRVKPSCVGRRTWLATLACAVQLWMTRSWPTCVTLVGTQQYLSELSIAGSEKYERKMCEAYRKVFARARFPLPRVALRGVGDVSLVYCEHGKRPCNELLLMRRWACGRADDHGTLHADLEMRDLLKTATSQSTPSATKPLRLRNVFKDFFDTERSQLIHNAEITLPFLASFGHDDPIEERCAPWIGQQDRPFTSH